MQTYLSCTAFTGMNHAGFLQQVQKVPAAPTLCKCKGAGWQPQTAADEQHREPSSQPGCHSSRCNSPPWIWCQLFSKSQALECAEKTYFVMGKARVTPLRQKGWLYFLLCTGKYSPSGSKSKSANTKLQAGKTKTNKQLECNTISKKNLHKWNSQN